MKKITFITTNTTKYLTAKNIFDAYGLSLERASYETPEIQSFDVEEIASFSAVYIAKQLDIPVMTADVGYYIPALAGFPGPYVKQMNTWFSSDQILTLMKGQSDRSIQMRECVAYCKPGHDPITFVTTTGGTIAHEARGEGTTLDTIIIRDGHENIQALYSKEEQLDYFIAHLDHYHQLCQHLVQQK